MDKKTVTIQVRVTEKEGNKLKMYAQMYAGGNVSRWLRYAGFNAPRKKLK